MRKYSYRRSGRPEEVMPGNKDREKVPNVQNIYRMYIYV